MCPWKIHAVRPAYASSGRHRHTLPERKSHPRTDGSAVGRNSIAKDVSESSSLCSVRNFPDPRDSSVRSGAGKFLGDRHPAECQGYAPQGRGTDDRRASFSPRKRNHRRAAKRKPRPAVPGNRPEPTHARDPAAPPRALPAAGPPSGGHRPVRGRGVCHFRIH